MKSSSAVLRALRLSMPTILVGRANWAQNDTLPPSHIPSSTTRRGATSSSRRWYHATCHGHLTRHIRSAVDGNRSFSGRQTYSTPSMTKESAVTQSGVAVDLLLSPVTVAILASSALDRVQAPFVGYPFE